MFDYTPGLVFIVLGFHCIKKGLRRRIKYVKKIILLHDSFAKMIYYSILVWISQMLYKLSGGIWTVFLSNLNFKCVPVSHFGTAIYHMAGTDIGLGRSSCPSQELFFQCSSCPEPWSYGWKHLLHMFMCVCTSAPHACVCGVPVACLFTSLSSMAVAEKKAVQ
jgi:hypothetical protein